VSDGWAARAHGYLIEVKVSIVANPADGTTEPVYSARGAQIGGLGYGTTQAEAIVDLLRQHRDSQRSKS
jgi:hypothetical protein